MVKHSPKIFASEEKNTSPNSESSFRLTVVGVVKCEDPNPLPDSVV